MAKARVYADTSEDQYIDISNRRSDIKGSRKTGPRGLGGPAPYETLILLPTAEFTPAYMSTHADAFRLDRKYWRVPKGVRVGTAFRAQLTVPSDAAAPFVTFAEVLDKGQKRSAWVDAGGQSTF